MLSLLYAAGPHVKQPLADELSWDIHVCFNKKINKKSVRQRTFHWLISNDIAQKEKGFE